MHIGIKLGLTFAAILTVSKVVGSGVWGLVVLLGIIAALSLFHAVIARNRAQLTLFSRALIVNAGSALVLAVLLILQDTVSFPWLLGLAIGVAGGLLATTWLIRRQGRKDPTTWVEFERELNKASVVDVLLGRPLNELASEP